MTAIDQHVLKVRSSVDGAEVPYLVSAPDPLPKTPLPFVFVLHDALADPSPVAFIEEAFRTAAEWKAVASEAPPALLVQPWGRGNASWFGPAGRALFDVWRQLEDQFLLANSAALFGIAAGGTGALQLAAHFPDRFHAVAAVNPWTDDRLTAPLGVADFPAWERPARTHVRPVDLAARLQGTAIALAHAPLGDSFTSFAAKRHFTALTDALERHGARWRDFSLESPQFSGRQPSIDRAAVWRFSTTSVSESSSPSRLTFPASLYWRPLSIVVGTIGETSECAVMRGLAERIRDRWLDGADANHPHRGDRRLIQEIPIVSDSDAAAEAPDGDLLVLGSPRTNLLAAKWADRLPVSWPSRESDEFSILGRTFADPSAFAVAQGKRPDNQDGRVWIVAAASDEAWVDVDRVRFAFPPDVFVQAKPGEILWMNHDEDETADAIRP